MLSGMQRALISLKTTNGQVRILPTSQKISRGTNEQANRVCFQLLLESDRMPKKLQIQQSL